MKSRDILRQRKALVFFLILLLIAFFYLIKPFLLPVILAVIITVLFYPVYQRILKAFGGRRKLAAFVSTLLVFVILVIPVSWIVAVLFNQLYGFVGTLDLKATFGRFFTAEFYVQYVKPWITQIEERFQVRINLLGVLTNFGKQVAHAVTSYSPAVLLGTATFLFDFFIMMFGIFFLFMEGPGLLKVFFDLSPLRETHERRLSGRVGEMIQATVYGYLVTSFVQGLIAWGIFAIVGIQTSVVLGALTFFMSMVPIVGAAGVWGPVCIWLFLQGLSWQGVVVLVGGVALISGIDNFLKPLLIQGKTKIHPLLIFFSLFGGIQLFGPLGILFGPVITALLIATINLYREEVVSG